MPNRRSADETARLGDELYERDIRPQVEADHRGEYVAVDVDTGVWAMADDARTAAEQLRAQQPDAVNVWLLRVGFRAMASIGGGSLRRTG
ncbi:MAG: hypothetical protein OXS47_14495 [Chloroflexota bacterium]|nr:hypothetical protein [Chloroflexota bacterium]